ncbi:hypothetical protein [Marinilabilia salmonicolor]|uniref:hypothetical protein n=1 Tax=Marinilabilia salmonicolor TaxID=989 RepID=UPI00046855DC|nr:hypothetical protein [Marinilabilia salmonicolor]
MRQFDFQLFWRKYGKFILGGLFFLFLINYCNQQPRNQKSVDNEQEERVKSQPVQEDEITTLKTYEELVTKRQLQENEGPGSFLTMFLLLTFAFGLVWLLQQKKVQQSVRKWLPQRVLFQVRKGRDSVTGRRILKIVIVNKTDEGLTFLPPNLVFRNWGKVRIFRLKGSNQEDMFPLTLTPGTSHRLVLDLEQFYEKLPDLKNSNRVGASVETTDDKKYSAYALPSWLSWLEG